MIIYNRGGFFFLNNIFQRKGSVFGKAFCIAFPCALVTVALKYITDDGHLEELDGTESILKDNAVWSGFSFLVGFCIVFRTSQAYSRFWSGCTAMVKMRSEWYAACSSAIAFSNVAKVERQQVLVFQHRLARLFSLLHMLSLAEIEDNNHDDPATIDAFKYELLDSTSLDKHSMRVVMRSGSKVELVFQWLQQLLAEAVDSGILGIAPPITSRIFQEMACGLVWFHDALQISSIPFPFPYAQTCDALLLLHWLVTPFVISQWVSNAAWALTFSFIQAFILWSLNCIAVEIENPFGNDPNDIDAAAMQLEFNRHIKLLLSPDQQRIPTLIFQPTDPQHEPPTQSIDIRSTFYDTCTYAKRESQTEGFITIVRSGRRSDRVRASNISRMSRGSSGRFSLKSTSCHLSDLNLADYSSEADSSFEADGGTRSGRRLTGRARSLRDKLTQWSFVQAPEGKRGSDGDLGMQGRETAPPEAAAAGATVEPRPPEATTQKV